MSYRLHHLHIKAADPERAAQWYAMAFDLEIYQNDTRPSGEKLIRCRPRAGGTDIFVSGPPAGQVLPHAQPAPHLGLEHVGIESEDLDRDIARLVELGAELADGPFLTPNVAVAFLIAPGGVRIELIKARAAS